MDALSRLLENIHLYETKFYYLEGYGEWSYALNTDAANTIVFYLVVEGSCCIEVMGAKRQADMGEIIMISNTHKHLAHSLNNRVALEQADELLLRSGVQTIEINKGAGTISVKLVLIVCDYDKELMRPLLRWLPHILPDQKPFSDENSELLNMGVEILRIESCNERIGKSAMINRMASIILIDCMRTYIEDLPEVTDNWLIALKDPYLAKALAVMHNAPETSWTIHKLAEIAGMSRSSFAERFKQTVGMPPLTYLIDYRLRLAARHLRLQQHSISQISTLVGYASDSTFSQAFKRIYGLSPRSYRQQFRIANPH